MQSDTQPTTISKLRPDTTGHSLSVTVINVNSISGKGGRSSKLFECLVGDQTGCILMTARQEQVGQLQPGECLEISNAQVDMFRSSMRLTAGPNGTVTKTEALGVDVNEDYNVSAIEFELVQIPSQPQTQQSQPAPSAQPETASLQQQQPSPIKSAIPTAVQ